MTPSEFKKKIRRIEKLFSKAEDILNSLPQEIIEESRQFHNEEGSIVYCIRWGLQATEDLQENAKKIVKRVNDNY